MTKSHDPGIDRSGNGRVSRPLAELEVDQRPSSERDAGPGDRRADGGTERIEAHDRGLGAAGTPRSSSQVDHAFSRLLP